MDVATSIISHKTLYNLHCAIIPAADEEKLYPAGVVSKALKNVAFQDEGLIQYKAEVMLRIFEEKIKPLIDGRAKAMIVTSSGLYAKSCLNSYGPASSWRHALLMMKAGTDGGKPARE